MYWRPLLLLALFGFVQAQIGLACAEPYPARPVRIVVAYPAGGSTDTTARLLAQALGEKTHGTFVIENRSGAGGVIGADNVAKSTADGYTLLYAASPELALVTSTKKSVPYDPVKDFVPISMIGRAPFVLVANKDFPPNDVKELIEYTKEHPNSVSFSSFGSGTSNHLAGEMLNLQAGITMLHIPYRGSAPSLTDLMAGQVQVTFDAITAVLPLLEAGQIKALAVATPQRLKALPTVPTLSESGLPGFTGGTWFALMAPADTPTAIVAELSKLTTDVLASADFQKALDAQGIVTEDQRPEAFNQFLSGEIDKWHKVVKQIGLVPQ
ncbi:Bug family tripartite tricarboxylate transporter substrate binding protein [Bradyrhizobium canariense]|uniref:Tripartite-type tricarboxylate transporter, receptor component TctC n=1 Tax=Bradyrhizobium canariense TaxID=255045 RepID=A0A1H1SP79_9BRAD|nr:tripartite tricarboxylate transporter substrate binding protein [Bradyrhizobium canariense]SDS49782.1 Tripartite-type tricarboxylate transporter, receptor component TctC [Bradyrhizobium canariense]